MVWGLFFRVWLGPLFLVKGNITDTAYTCILDNCMIPPFEEGLFQFQLASAPVYKVCSIKTWHNEFGVGELG